MIKSTNENGTEIYMLTSIGELENCKESIKSLLHFLCNTHEYNQGNTVTAEDIEVAGTQLGELMARVHRFQANGTRTVPTLTKSETQRANGARLLKSSRK